MSARSCWRSDPQAAAPYCGSMTYQPQEQPQSSEDQPVLILPADHIASEQEPNEERRNVTDMVEQPAKVMRIGNMIRQLLDEVKAAPLDEASRNRLREIHTASIRELEDGLAPELVEELDKLSLPFGEETPSDAELRIAQAQLEQMRRALPGGGPPAGLAGPGRPGPGPEGDPSPTGGMYL